MREHEVFPPPNPRLLAQVDCADAIVYGMGSLYTSICPSLVLKVWGSGTCTCRHHHAHHRTSNVQSIYTENRHSLFAVKAFTFSPALLVFSSQRAACGFASEPSACDCRMAPAMHLHLLQLSPQSGHGD